MDTLEIIRQLQQDPALKAELRAVLLGEELLEVPSLIGKLAESLQATNARVESLIDHQAGMQSSLNDLIQMVGRSFVTMEQGFTEIRGGFGVVNQRLDTVDQRLDHVDVKIDGLDAKFTAKLDQVDSEIRDIKSDVGDIKRHLDI